MGWKMDGIVGMKGLDCRSHMKGVWSYEEKGKGRGTNLHDIGSDFGDVGEEGEGDNTGYDTERCSCHSTVEKRHC